MDVNQLMREDWDRRAREDAHFYVAFARQGQSEEEFLASAAETVATLKQEFVRLPDSPAASRRALEIGCGPGRLMIPMSQYFGEIHGIDISEEMVEIARKRLRNIRAAHVHLTPESNLAMFEDGYFDFIYSYTVFQHIPERQIVLDYFRESRRVLKPGGVLCCQLRGAPPLASEMEREASTWTGCFFNSEEIAGFAREHEFHLVALNGVDTQYMWTTWVKPDSCPDVSEKPNFVLKAVTASSSGADCVPARGRDAVVSLWIDGLPSDCHLGNLQVGFGRDRKRGCYLSPLSEGGACQMNSRLPAVISPGRAVVTLYHRDSLLGSPKFIEVTSPAPRRPKIVSVTDGINIASKFRIETGGVKVVIEDIDSPSTDSVCFTLGGRPAEYLQFERKDPIADTYEFAFHLSHRTPLGIHLLVIELSGHKLEPVSVEVAGLSHRNHGHNADDTGGAPSPSRDRTKG